MAKEYYYEKTASRDFDYNLLTMDLGNTPNTIKNNSGQVSHYFDGTSFCQIDISRESESERDQNYQIKLHIQVTPDIATLPSALQEIIETHQFEERV